VRINQNGEIVGNSSNATEERAVLWSGGAILDLGVLPGRPRSRALGLNDRGQVVGICQSSTTDLGRAFVWDLVNGIRDLNALIPAGSGWVLNGAASINSSGQIVGLGTRGGTTTGFLLTPRP
jgi:probable HAF family extracellular repeat protein